MCPTKDPLDPKRKICARRLIIVQNRDVAKNRFADSKIDLQKISTSFAMSYGQSTGNQIPFTLYSILRLLRNRDN